MKTVGLSGAATLKPKAALDGSGLGSVTFCTMIVPPCGIRVLVKTQVTVSPGSRVMAAGSLPSSQVAPVSSQSAGTISVTEYVPESRSVKLWVSPSCSKKVVGVSGSVAVKLKKVPDGSGLGSIVFFTRITPDGVPGT